MRVTFNYLNMKYLDGIQKSLSNMAESNDKVQSGRNLLNPEDDPVAYATALNMQRLIDESDQFKRNAENSLTWIENTDNELQRASELLSMAANEYAVYGMNDSQDATSRAALAGDVQSVIDSLTEIANANYLGRYIFGGYETDTQPFTTDDRKVYSVVSNYTEANAISRKLYGDMTELTEGEYHITAQIVNDMVYVTMKDDNNNTVVLDSNGSDESTGLGNRTSQTLSMKYEQGMYINTGTGVGIKLPDEDMNGKTLTLDFMYQPGDDMQYVGDNGEIITRIGSSQEVSINIAGQEIFLETNKTVKGSVTNTINNLPITETSYLKNIDGSNISDADAIQIIGTDHNGYKVGIAMVTAHENAELDLSQASTAERSVTLNYAGENYTLTMDQESYADIEDLVFNANRELENLGLGDEIIASYDGDRMLFHTTRSGSDVQLKVTGSDHNKLGFHNVILTGQGKNTTFNLYYDGYNQSVSTTHTGITVAAGTNTWTINGEPLTITTTGGETSAQLEAIVDAAIDAAGFGFEVDSSIVSAAATMNITFTAYNSDFNNETYLATTVDDAGATDYQFDTPRDADYPLGSDKRVSDLLEFVENLYDNTVDAYIEDGNLMIKDTRAGSSKMTFRINETNTGIGYSQLDPGIMVKGRYEGSNDDKWTFNTNITGGNVIITATDKNGNVVYDNTSSPLPAATYYGQEIPIDDGVSIVLGQVTANTSFIVDLTANANLSFGDLNVIEEGSNVDMFKSLQNLQQSLELNIPDSGIAAPSAWNDDSLASTAVPYFDGEFRGNYNDVFNYEVLLNDDQSEFYVQQMLDYTSDTVRYYDGADIDFDINILDDDTITSVNIAVANGSYSDKDELMDALITQINTNATLVNLGVHAVDIGGQLKIESGSGTKEISVDYNNDESIYALALDNAPATGTEDVTLDLSSASASERTLELNYYNGAAWQTQNITVPAAAYASNAALETAIDAEIASAGLGAVINASVNSDGVLSFSPTAPVTDIVVGGDADNTLGFYTLQQPSNIEGAVITDLDYSESTADERTLTFYYNDGTDRSASITITKQAYADMDELITEINSQLTSAGLSDITAVKQDDSKVSFTYSGSTTSLHVSGDYEASMGFFQAGDEAKIKVTGSDGEMIAEYSVNTANDSSFVADGIYSYFNTGYLYATDSFTGAVGSGIQYEMDVLDQAETQLHKALTMVGTRHSKVNAAITFHETINTTNEEIKGEYVGATAADKSAAVSEFTMAQQAYQYALSATAKIMNISLLDFLR